MRTSQKTSEIIATIGIDLGKNTFHLVGLDERGAIVLQQKISRGQLERRRGQCSYRQRKKAARVAASGQLGRKRPRRAQSPDASTQTTELGRHPRRPNSTENLSPHLTTKNDGHHNNEFSFQKRQAAAVVLLR
jgi:hypothetical protein